MAKDQAARLKPKSILDDTVTNDALKSVIGYAPVNSQCTLANIKTLFDAMMTAQASETQANAALKTARDKAISAEWSFHNVILDAKVQVKAQFGKDSNEIQALGLKKASEYKRRTVKKKRNLNF